MKSIFHFCHQLPLQFSRTAVACGLLILLPALVGCPDYSQQRDVPDYQNMTDEGALEDGVTEEPK